MESYNLNRRFEIHPDTIYRIINGRPLVFNYKTGDIIELNGTGSLIWGKLPNHLSKIIDELAIEFTMPKTEIQSDVLEFIDVLKENNFVIEGKKVHFPRNVAGELIHLNEIEKIGIKECIPIVAKIELLYRCNLKCIHCFNITGKWRKGRLTTPEIKSIIDQLYDIGTVLISFTGGEIFLRKGLWDIIEYADSKDFLIELLTNGTLITEQDAEMLKNYRISNVQISMYSHIPEVHDSVTGVSGSYEKSVRAIEYLVKNKINVEIVTPLMKVNFHDYKEIRELAAQLGVTHSYTYPIFERYNGSKDVYDLRISIDQILQFFLENPQEISYKDRDSNQSICDAGTNQCSISPFGDVFPCFHNMFPMKFGNLFNQPLKDIWANSESLKNFRNLRIRDLNRCSKCPAISYCNICPGLNVKANKELLEPAQICCDYAFSAKECIDSGLINIKDIKRLKKFLLR